MYNIAVMGDRDSIYCFASIGFTIFPVESPEDAVSLLRRLSESDYAVIYIIEKLALQIEAEIERYSSRAVPAVIIIPGVSGNTGIGMRNVSKSVEKAVGSDILGNN